MPLRMIYIRKSHSSPLFPAIFAPFGGQSCEFRGLS